MKKKQARVDVFAAQTADEAVQRRVPRALEDLGAQPAGTVPPIRHAVVEPKHARDLGEPVESGPANNARMRMDAVALAILPQPRIRLQGRLRGPLAERLEPAEKTDI